MVACRLHIVGSLLSPCLVIIPAFWSVHLSQRHWCGWPKSTILLLIFYLSHFFYAPYSSFFWVNSIFFYVHLIYSIVRVFCLGLLAKPLYCFSRWPWGFQYASLIGTVSFQLIWNVWRMMGHPCHSAVSFPTPLPFVLLLSCILHLHMLLNWQYNSLL